MTLGPPRPAQTVLAADAAHPCACVRRHRPLVAEYEMHHVHMAAVQRNQGLVLTKLTAANEWYAGQDMGDEQAAYWLSLCPTTHSAVHILLRRYKALGGATEPDDHGFNRLALRVAEEGNRRVMLHGGWPA